ncbi:PDZ domain-containing protein [Rhodoblastus acidophilus]|uniref:PDZ domain-containing protein n=1 Tax=Rhodoblastus acidophilus TaxID=1074 RepID=A0A6N8DK27_RHOAC|nr:M50 family metallopeptidase [Rhodoblastus acidophilus]MCW2273928.1 regulator of sigma E protease [Rhodoblastus acidophilus]MTV30930.1 PDZ domain-containing protein [Rhodoblastus acidophilus]
MPLIDSVWTLVGTYLVPFIFVLSLVVFFHELGHFLVGRACGIKVDVFSLGFGPEIAGFNDRYGTRWRLALLPLGGYVKFHGDANGASATDNEAIDAMPEAERAVTFAAQNVWKRAATVAAGPIANFILALAIFTVMFFVQGRDVLTPRVDKLVEGGRAAISGFKTGDVVTSIDGKKIESFGEMQRIVTASGDVTLKFTILRDGRELELTATPERREIKTAFGPERIGLLGISSSGAPESWTKKYFTVPGAMREAGKETWYVISRTGAYLGGLVVGRESPQQLSGPLRIAEVSGEVAKSGLWALLNLAAILSISVGLLNLLPVPLLDGGHLLYFVAEALRGRALPERAQELGFRFGMAFVAGLMIVATYNDIARLTKQWLNLG